MTVNPNLWDTLRESLSAAGKKYDGRVTNGSLNAQMEVIAQFLAALTPECHPAACRDEAIWRNVVEDEKAKAHHEGSNEMLRWIRGALLMYPNGGGDAEVMEQVDRIVAERVAVLENQTKHAVSLAEEMNVELKRLEKELRLNGG